MYYNTETGEFGLHEGDVRSYFEQAGVLVIWPDPFAPREPFFSVVLAEKPAHNPATHRAVEIAPKETADGWLQQWKVAKLTQAELAQIEAEHLAAEQAAKDAARIIITRTQGLIALYRMQGIEESAIQAFIDQIEDAAERYEAGVYFRASNWHSDDPFVLRLAALVGADTEEKLRALFEYAKTL